MYSNQSCTRKQAPRAAIRNPKAVRTCPFGKMCPYLRFAGHCRMDLHLANKPAEAEMQFIAELEAGQRPCKGAPKCPRADCIFCIVMKKLAAEKPVETVAVAPKCQCNQWGCNECNPN